MPNQDDEPLADLIARAREGDREAWGRICALYGDTLRKRIRNRLDEHLRRHLDSMDIVNSVLKDLPEHLHLYRHHDSPQGFVNWCTRIVARKVLERKRHEASLKAGGAHRIEAGDCGRELMEAHLAKGDTPSQAAAANEEKELLAHAMASLDPKHREPLLLHLDGLTDTQVGEKIGCSEDAARMKVNRAELELERRLRRLRKPLP